MRSLSNWADMQATPDAPINPPEEPDYCSGSLCDLCRVPAERCPGTDPELQVNEDADEPPPPDVSAWTRGYLNGYLAAKAGWPL